MASYRLVFKKSVAKDLRPLPKQDITRILQRARALANEPKLVGCEKLSGQERYRLREGVYRIVYEIADNERTVVVVKIGHRRDVYRS